MRSVAEGRVVSDTLSQIVRHFSTRNFRTSMLLLDRCSVISVLWIVEEYTRSKIGSKGISNLTTLVSALQVRNVYKVTAMYAFNLSGQRKSVVAPDDIIRLECSLTCAALLATLAPFFFTAIEICSFNIIVKRAARLSINNALVRESGIADTHN